MCAAATSALERSTPQAITTLSMAGRERSSQLNVENQVLTLVQNAENAYWDVVGARENLKVEEALGKIAYDTYLDVLKARGTIRSRAPFVFGHNRQFATAPGQPLLIACYHPSQQNTSTGKLTEKMLLAVFRRARSLLVV